MVKYIKLYIDDRKSMSLLSAEEKGRLLDAMLAYADGVSEEEITAQLTGNERIMFPGMQARLDRELAELDRLSEVRSSARKRAVKPVSAPEEATAAADDREGPTFDNKCRTPATHVNKCRTPATLDNKCRNKDKDKDKDKNKDNIPPSPDGEAPQGAAPQGGRAFRRPTVDEVAAYAAEKGYALDAAAFVDFYTAKGWKVGREPMKDWQAAVRNWMRRQQEQNGAVRPPKVTTQQAYTQREYTEPAADELPDWLRSSLGKADDG